MQSGGLFYADAMRRLAAPSALSSTSRHSLRLLDRETPEPRSLELKRRLNGRQEGFAVSKTSGL